MIRIKFKIPAIAVDEDGNEQVIEMNVDIEPDRLSRVGDVVSGFCENIVGNESAHFSFREEHPFKAFKS